ncbi:MAG: O-antigen ligase family protein [Candidatus Omnitrophota bacterium]
MSIIENKSVSATRAPKIRKGIIFWTYFVFVAWVPIESIYVIKDDENSGGFTISRLVGILLFGAAVLNWRLCFKRFPAVFWMVLWYLLVYSLSVFWLPGDPEPQFYSNQITLVQLIILFLISLNLFNDASFRQSLLNFYGWWTSLIAIGMLFGVIGGEFLGFTGRMSILEQDPNIAAGFFALGAICIIGNVKKVISKSGVTSIFAVCIFIVAILQTGSRGGMSAFIAGVLGFGICIGKRNRFLSRAMIVGVVIGLLGYLVMQEFQEGTVMAFRLDQALREGDTAGRTKIWEAAWTMFLDKPILGYGGYNNFLTLGSHLNLPIRDTHNLFLALLTEVGLVGAVPFIVAFFYTLKKSWSYGKNTGNALPFALICTLLAMNLSITGNNQKLFWIVFAVAGACGMESRNDL